MANVLLVNPWLYTDENVTHRDLSHEWRNGPLSLLTLATQLIQAGHTVQIADLARTLVACNGNLDACLKLFGDQIVELHPDILGFGFFSVHFLEVKKALHHARSICKKKNIKPLFVGGGIHASIEPESTLNDLNFDCLFVGEADVGLVELANGATPDNIRGVYTGSKPPESITRSIKSLDELPFPEWSLVDYQFYNHPTYARLGTRKSSSLDILMGRGCAYRCSFCAYSTLSTMRYHSSEYILGLIRHMNEAYSVSGFYFLDSTIGTNRKLLIELCEGLIKLGESKRIEWYANIRVDQVDEALLKLMWGAGCRCLFYGFESGSQRILDKMNKKTSVDLNANVAELHYKLNFPYIASMVLGFPGETEDDIMQTFMFLKKTKPPRVGINWYVPLPGSEDYAKLRKTEEVNVTNPEEWRGLGCVGEKAKVYASVSDKRFRHLFNEITSYVHTEMRKENAQHWGIS